MDHTMPQYTKVIAIDSTKNIQTQGKIILIYFLRPCHIPDALLIIYFSTRSLNLQYNQ